MDITTYLQQPLQLRQEHLNLSTSCDHAGGRGGSRKIRMRRNLFALLDIPYAYNIKQFGACLCHRCPNGSTSGDYYCVNPEHIYLGTLSENAKDALKDNPGLGKKRTVNSQPIAVLAAMSQEARINRKEAFRKIKHSQGERNSQYGTMWVTDGSMNRKVKKTEPVPEGYWRGRTLN